MRNKTRDIFRQNALLALAVIGSSSLALLLAFPPGYVSPLFPPAGIALAALLVYGLNLTWGLYAATVVVSLLAQWNTGTAEPNIWLALFGALGPTLQAIAGVCLMRQIRLWPGGLDEVRSSLLFVCLVAPVSAMVSATLTIPALTEGSSTDLSVFLGNWVTWWAGDTLGIILFTPITLSLLVQTTQEWRGRWRVVALPLLVCSFVFACVMLFVRQREEIRIDDEFRRSADQYANVLSSRLTAQMDMLMSIERFASVTSQFSREDWSRITLPWLARYPGTRNLTWNPLVRAGEIKSFEAQEHASGHPDFHIYDRDINGQLLPPAKAPEYLPITYVEPLAENRRALGVNVLSLPESARVIGISRQTAKPAVTRGIRLVQAPTSPQSVVVYQAVFEQEDDSRSPLRGIVSMALQLESIVPATHNELHSHDVELCLFDQTDTEPPQILFGPPGCSNAGWTAGHLSTKRWIGIADRKWKVVLRSPGTPETFSLSWASVAAQVVSLSFSGMLCAFLLLMTGRTRRIEEQVAQRTLELASATAQLRDQKASLAQAQRIARIGSWEMASGSSHLHCSEEFRRLLGLPASGRILLDDVLIRLGLDDRSRLSAMICDATLAPLSNAVDCSTLADEKGQQILHFQIESEWMMGRRLRVHGTVQNVTSIRQAEAHIQYLARFDSLTGLPNRNHWQDLARAALNAARRHKDQAAVLFLDLDHFKNVNDSLGHTIGDELLATVANRLKSCLRADDILARQGGDEFVLLLPRLSSPDEVGIVAAKLVRNLSLPMQLRGHELSVSVSIGIAHYPSDGQDIDTLLKHADVAMYSAKQSGRNNFQFFVPEMNQRAMQRLQMESSLRRAIERGELILHFQPQMDMEANRIDGCEALVRWMNPERGMVPPGEFIPLAEESGLILPLGDWVLAEACRQQAQWERAGFDISVAINISALQFRQNDFIGKLNRVVEETQANPHHLELEITESALLGSTEELVETLESIRDKGMRLALDDFGTGYSSLSYLKRLPIERLKIDRSFVKDLPGDAEDAAIASATLSMARDLGMEVVAEGVETEAQRDFLAQRRCRFIQGYLIGKPMPAADFAAWLLEREKKPDPS